jgi:hypothetical protein
LPTPTFQQYFFSALPFAILSVGLMCQSIRPVWGATVMAALALVSIVGAPEPLRSLGILTTPSRWTPMKAHDIGTSILPVVSQGTIVTLAPIYPLEAGLTVFPELATGPFAYRVGTLMSAEERRRQRILDVDDMGSVIGERKPAALLLGFEPEELEEPLAQYAQQQKYRYAQLPSGKHLWLPR